MALINSWKKQLVIRSILLRPELEGSSSTLKIIPRGWLDPGAASYSCPVRHRVFDKGNGLTE